MAGTASNGSGSPDEGPEVVRDDGGHPANFLGRMSQTFLKPPRPKEPEKPFEQLSESEKAERIRQVDPTERKLGYLAAGLVAIIGFLAFGKYVANPSLTVHQTVKRSGGSCPSGFKDTVVRGVHQCSANIAYSRGHWVFLLGVLLFFALFIALTVKVGKRSFMAFAILFSGFAIEAVTGSIIGLIFVAGGGWLIMRAYRVQRYGSPTAKGAMAGASDRAASKRAGPAKATPRSVGGRTKKGAEAEDAGRPKPDANKRYTPKAPQRKRASPPG